MKEKHHNRAILDLALAFQPDTSNPVATLALPQA
jgi:hypothetical protein